MAPELWSLYELMFRSRLLEQATERLWRDGLVSGELHLGTGEEAIIAGVVSQLQEGDGMALDHRGTAALVMRGVAPALILRELLGHPGGLGGGMAGHMHLHSREHLAAASGVVGAVGPAAAGLALAAQYLRPGAVAVGFFGEGAMNEGMLMESLNLAAVWTLPALFVCKDDAWSITTRSEQMTGGDLADRARALGVPAVSVDGTDVLAVWQAASSALARARGGGGATFILARCVHLEAHFAGFQLLRMVRQPLREMPRVLGPLVRSALRAGATLGERLAGMRSVNGALISTMRDPRHDVRNDPVWRARRTLLADRDRLLALEDSVEQEVGAVVESVLQEVAA